MSVGFFLGIKNSYPDAFQDDAEKFIAAINTVLRAENLPEYVDGAHSAFPGFGRSKVDHFGYTGLGRFHCFAREHDRPEIADVSGPKEVFLPLDFPAPLPVPFGKFLWFTKRAYVSSSHTMRRALLKLAMPLAIEIVDGNVTDDVALRISDEERFRAEDDEITICDLRPVWLLYFEGARLSIETGRALSVG